MSYDPSIGRWTQEDPIGFAGGDVNLYRYVGNSPTNHTDPTGLYEEDVHFYLTYLLAMAVGLDKIESKYRLPDGSFASEAYMIAWAAQHVDDNPETRPISMTGPASEAVLRMFHFRFKSTEKCVKRDTPFARQIADKGAINSDPIYFGIGLHAFQDSYSHEGFVARPFGHAGEGHSPDMPFKDLEKAVEMARATYYQMKAYAAIRGCEATDIDFPEAQVRLLLGRSLETTPDRVKSWKDWLKKYYDLNVRYGYQNEWDEIFNKVRLRVINENSAGLFE